MAIIHVYTLSIGQGAGRPEKEVDLRKANEYHGYVRIVGIETRFIYLRWHAREKPTSKALPVEGGRM